MTLYYIFPLTGPVNGVKVISKHILTKFKEENFPTIVVDVAQAKEFSNYGAFNFKKLAFLATIYKQLRTATSSDYAYMNFSTLGFSKFRDYLILLYLHIKKVNTTLHVHANGIENIKLPLFKKLLKNSTVIVINKNQAEKMDKYIGLRCINNCLPDYYNCEFSPAKIGTNQSINFLFLSNLSLEKGAELLFKITQFIHDKKIEATVTICGGILDKESEALVLEMKQKFKFVTFLGPITNQDEKMRLLKNSDFLLFLSKKNYEVFPLVYIEALMNGLPILSTEQIVADYILKNNCGYIIKEDVMEVTLEHILTNTNFNVLRQNARERFEEEFDFSKFYTNIKNAVLNVS